MNALRPLFIDEVQKESSILEEIKLIVDSSYARGENEEIAISYNNKVNQTSAVD